MRGRVIQRHLTVVMIAGLLPTDGRKDPKASPPCSYHRLKKLVLGFRVTGFRV